MGPSIVWVGLPDTYRFTAGVARCHLCSAAVYKDDQQAHQTFHDTYINRSEVETMSGVAWCDPGSHAFKAGEPGSQSFQGSTVDENGAPQRIQMDACAKHSFQPSNTETTKAIDTPTSSATTLGASSKDTRSYGPPVA